MISYKLFSNSFYYLIYYFALYSFGGWCIEVIYAYYKDHKFVNRGFLFGPFCPMYGFAAILIISLLAHSTGNIFVLFIVSTIVATIVEYFTGLALEKIFHAKWWDYSDDILNYKGRIALPYSLLWGLLSVFIIKVLNPFFSQGLSFSVTTKGIVFLDILFFYFWIDFALTLVSVTKLSILLYKVNSIYSDIKGRIELIRENSLTNFDVVQIIPPELKKQYDTIILNMQKKYSRLTKAFPEFTVRKIDGLKEDLKNKIISLKNRRNE